MSALENAWLTLKAQPGAQGMYGTVHPAIAGMPSNEYIDEYMGDSALDNRQGIATRVLNPVATMRGGMLNRLRGKDLEMLTPEQRAELEGMTDTFSGRGDAVQRDVERPGEMTASVPVPLGNLGGGRGDPIPQSVAAIERDISPLREDVVDQMGTSMALNPNTGQLEVRHPTQTIPMLDVDPEQSFTTPLERARGREGMTSAADRMVSGSRGGRFDVRGGARSGQNLLNLGMQTDQFNQPVVSDKTGRAQRNPFARQRSASKLSNVEGMRTGGFGKDPLSGMSTRFIQPEQEEAPQEMSQEDRIRAMLEGMMTPGGSKIQEVPVEEEKPERVSRKLFEPRMTGARRQAMDDMQRQPMSAEEKEIMLSPGLRNTPTMRAFADPSSPEAQQFARQQLMQAAMNMGRQDGSKAQGAIDRSA
jgi:hypothetical protein